MREYPWYPWVDVITPMSQCIVGKCNLKGYQRGCENTRWPTFCRPGSVKWDCDVMAHKTKLLLYQWRVLADRYKMFTMCDLITMQLPVSGFIASCILVKVSYLILNKYLHPPYQRIVCKARLVAGMRRWSASTNRLRCWYSSLNKHQPWGSNARNLYQAKGNIAGENTNNAHVWGRDVIAVSPSTLN